MSKPRRQRVKPPILPELGLPPELPAPVEGGSVSGGVERPYTPQQMAKFLQVSVSTIGRYVRADEIPFMRVGNRIRFFPREVVHAIRTKRQK